MNKSEVESICYLVKEEMLAKCRCLMIRSLEYRVQDAYEPENNSIRKLTELHKISF